MKNKVSKSKKKKVDTKKLIGIDQPFDYEEVVSITGPDYVGNLHRNGIAVLPYEELKKNVPGFKLLEDRCIWMKAGIINFRKCDYDNDCYNCPFDHAIRSAMGEKGTPARIERQASWVRQLQEKYKVAVKPCIHFKSGRIESPEECIANYECYACHVHEMLYAEKQAQTIKKPKYTNVSGFQVADDYYHHLGHSWIHLEHDGRVRVGIDAFISKVFGAADTIDLPPVGAFLKQGELGWLMTRDGLKAPMQSPLSGSVCAVNDRIKEQPGIPNNDPYEAGWLFLLDPADLKLNLKGLYYGKECFQWIERENQNILEFLEPQYQRLAAIGGELVDDIYIHLPGMSWHRLVCAFLHTAEKG